MLQTVLDIILYIPRRIYGHFEYIRQLEKENADLEMSITNRNVILKRILVECEYNMQINNYGSNYRAFNKIKELAQTFPQEQ